MSAPTTMTKDEMAAGLAAGRTLIQDERSSADEILWVDQLIAEGRAVETAPWGWSDAFQCSRRKVTGVPRP